LEESRWRYSNFFLMYFLQGMVPGLFGACLMNYYIAHGFTVSMIGSFGAIVAIPWSLQFLWGPVVDSFRSSRMGARRFWQVIAYVACAASLITMSLVIHDPIKQTSLLCGMLFAHSLFASLMDVSTDALMIDNVPEEERGRSSSAGRMGFVIGGALSTLLFAPLLSNYGFSFSVSVLAAIWIVVGAVPILTREKKVDSLFTWARRAAPVGAVKSPASVKAFTKELAQALFTPTGLKLCALFFLVDFSLGAFGVGFGVDLIQKYGWDEQNLTRVGGLLSLFGGTAVAFGIGWFSDKIGHFKALKIFLITCAALHVFFAILFAYGWDVELSPLMMVMQSLVPSFLFVAAVPAIMSLDKSPLAATRFTLIMAAMNFGDVAGGAAAGTLLKIFPHVTFSLIIAAIFVGGAVILHKPTKKTRRALAPIGPLVPVVVTHRPASRLGEKTPA
ncbi:MAG: MFS transporter, partial [Proteobacteria bacterium]